MRIWALALLALLPIAADAQAQLKPLPGETVKKPPLGPKIPGTAQKVAPPLHDPSPFTKPEPICSINTQDAPGALKKLLEIVKAESFAMLRLVDAQGWFEAERMADKLGQDSDRVIVWLERDFERPAERQHVHLMYGRFIKLFGKPDLQRVQAPRDFVETRIGALRQRILNHCAS